MRARVCVCLCARTRVCVCVSVWCVLVVFEFFWVEGGWWRGGGGGVYSRPLGEFNGGCDICNMENVFPFWCTAMSLQSGLQLDTHDESACIMCPYLQRPPTDRQNEIFPHDLSGLGDDGCRPLEQ